MRNKLDDLRNHLFATLEALQDKDDPMDIDRARAVSDVSGRVIESAKVEVDFLKTTGAVTGSDFFKNVRDPEPIGTQDRRAIPG